MLDRPATADPSATVASGARNWSVTRNGMPSHSRPEAAGPLQRNPARDSGHMLKLSGHPRKCRAAQSASHFVCSEGERSCDWDRYGCHLWSLRAPGLLRLATGQQAIARTPAAAWVCAPAEVLSPVLRGRIDRPSGLAPRPGRLRLLLREHPLEEGDARGLGPAVAALRLRRLVGLQLRPGEQRAAAVRGHRRADRPCDPRPGRCRPPSGRGVRALPALPSCALGVRRDGRASSKTDSTDRQCRRPYPLVRSFDRRVGSASPGS